MSGMHSMMRLVSFGGGKRVSSALDGRPGDGGSAVGRGRNRHATLIAYWDYNGEVNDQSGNGNNGAINGTVPYVAGKFSQAASFQRHLYQLRERAKLSDPFGQLGLFRGLVVDE